VLVSYLSELRTNPHPTAISHRLRAVLPEFDSQFASYISQIRADGRAARAL